MFSLKKGNNYSSESLEVEPEIDLSDISIHTMNDDLDALNGKIITKEVSQKPEGNLNKKEDVEKTASAAPKNAGSYSKGAISSTVVSSSPFLNSNISPNQNFAPLVPPKKENSFVYPSSKKELYIIEDKKKPEKFESTEKKINWTRALTAVTVIITILAVVIAGYYFWITRKSQESSTRSQSLNQPESDTQINQEEPPKEPPRYLSVDIENAAAENIKQLFIKTAAEVKESETTSPAEFILSDTNNNPIAFPIFAITSGINLPPNVLNNLEESFSLYFYNDGGNSRLGLTVKLKDKEKIKTGIAQEEKNLANDLSLLFLDNAIEGKNKTFSNSQHGDFQIRYTNLNQANGLSLDYAITENYLVIGTSKNTLRAVLDNLTQE